MPFDKNSALLAMQKSLLGEIFSALRAVTMRIAEGELHFDAYIDGALQDEDLESMSCVETELIAALPDSVIVSHAVHRVDLPLRYPLSDIFVYARRE